MLGLSGRLANRHSDTKLARAGPAGAERGVTNYSKSSAKLRADSHLSLRAAAAHCQRSMHGSRYPHKPACGPGPSPDPSCSAYYHPAVPLGAPLCPTHPHAVLRTMANKTEMRVDFAKYSPHAVSAKYLAMLIRLTMKPTQGMPWVTPHKSTRMAVPQPCPTVRNMALSRLRSSPSTYRR